MRERLRRMVRRGTGPSGQTLVEVTLMLPILAMVVISLVMFSDVVKSQYYLNAAAREGARAGTLTTGTVDGVEQAVNNILTGSGLDPANATITVLNVGPGMDFDDLVTVRVEYTYIFLQGVMGSSSDFNFDLVSELTMRHE